MIQKIATLVMLAVIVLSLDPRSLYAAKPSKEMLPASTKFSYSVASGREFNQRLETTQFGQMLADPALKPFLDDLPRQLRSQASDHPLAALRIDLGVDSTDLNNLAMGEVTWALVHPQGSDPSRVFMADVTGQQEQVDELLQKLAASMRELGAKKTKSTLDRTPITVYDIPASANISARKLAFFQEADQLVFAESAATLRTLLNNLNRDGSAADTLANQAGYQEVINQCQQRASNESPDAVVFLIPVDLSDALRQLSPKQDERADEGVAVARKHNFDAISAVGGFVTVGRGAFDFHVRVAIHAPQPWKNGMRSFRLPNGSMTVPSWVRSDNHGFTMINIDFAQFAKYFGPLFDDTYGEGEEGLYDDLKNTLLEDPDGPQIDVDKEIFGRLSPQTIFLARDALPVTPDSPQRLIAYSTSDEAALTAVIKEVLESDPNSEAQSIQGHDVFFSYIEEEDDFGSAPAAGDENKAPSFITCVANGHLMFATDVKILEEAISKGDSLVGHTDYQDVTPYLKHVSAETCIQCFGRLQEAMRVNYELLRQGKKPNSAKSFKGLLHNIALGEPPEITEPKFDGSKLPPFEQVAQYFGLAGLDGIATDDGWYLEGFVLKK